MCDMGGYEEYDSGVGTRCWGSFCSLRAMEFCFWTCFTTVFSYDSTLIVGLIVQRLLGSAQSPLVTRFLPVWHPCI